MTVTFVEKLRALAELSTKLQGKCATCWALCGKFVEKDHSLFSICGSGRQPKVDLKRTQYESFKPKFDDFTACWTCWLPQLHRSVNRHLYDHTTHGIPISPKACTHPYAFKEIAWVVFQALDLRNAFLRDSQVDGQFPYTPQATVAEYCQYLTRDKEGMVNVGHVAYWLFQHYRLKFP
jgi:hypothetical protein